MPPPRRFGGNKARHDVVELPTKRTIAKPVTVPAPSAKVITPASLTPTQAQPDPDAAISLSSALTALEAAASHEEKSTTLVHGLGSGMEGGVLELVSADVVRQGMHESAAFDRQTRIPAFTRRARLHVAGSAPTSKSREPASATVSVPPELRFDPLELSRLMGPTGTSLFTAVPDTPTWLPLPGEWDPLTPTKGVSAELSVSVRAATLEAPLTEGEKRRLRAIRQKERAREKMEALKQVDEEKGYKGAVTLVNAPRPSRVGAVVASLSSGDSMTRLEQHIRELSEQRLKLRAEQTEAMSADEHWLSRTSRGALDTGKAEHWFAVLRVAAPATEATRK